MDHNNERNNLDHSLTEQKYAIFCIAVFPGTPFGAASKIIKRMSSTFINIELLSTNENITFFKIITVNIDESDSNRIVVLSKKCEL